MPTMPKSAEGFKFILVTVFMAIRTKNGKIYSESRIDIDSVGPVGEPGFSVFTIGFRYDFSWRISHQ
jgi:hypothetical protein